jgi:hypothetical protein
MEDFYFIDRFNGSALHGNRCTAGCEAHTNFTNESACLTADNILQKSIYNSQTTGYVENAVPLEVHIFRN